MARFYLGVDGGQSSTFALIAGENGAIAGAGRGGPCNHAGRAEGRARFLQAVGDCLNQACSQAGLRREGLRFAAVCLGFSGGPEDKQAYSRELIPSDKYKITHDAEIALSGATAGRPGIIVIGGTGSMAFGRNVRGETARAGGWGYIYGDEGGGFDIVRQAVRAALRFEEGWGPATSIHAKLLAATGAPTANTLLHRLYNQIERAGVAQLAPIVAKAAEEGDKSAIGILDRAGAKLAWFTGGVYSNLFKAHEEIPVVPVGGVFSSVLMRQAFAAKIMSQIGCPIAEPRLSPAAGAVLDALRMDGNLSELSGVPEFNK